MSREGSEDSELERLRRAVDAAGLHVWDFDLEAILDVPAELAVAPDDRGALVAALRAHIAGENDRFECEYRVLQGDGTMRWWLARGVALRDDAARPTRVIGSSVDITQLKQAQDELRQAKDRLETAMTGSKVSTWQSEERFRRTFENAAVGMIITDPDGRILELNARFGDFLGSPRGELVGRRLAELATSEQIEADLEGRSAVLRGDLPWFTQEVRHVRGDGSIAWGSLTLSVIERHLDGTAAQVMGILQDITERKALEVEIERAQTRIVRAMRGSDVAVFEGVFPDGNIAASRWSHFNMWESMGYDPANAPTDLSEILELTAHPDDRAAHFALFQATVKAKSPHWYAERRHFNHDGSVSWRLSRGTLVYNEAGVLTSFSGTLTDITKLKMIQSELERAQQAAESANRAKDEFLANVSHEIRTPMNAILGMTELALESSPTEHQKELLTTVRTAAKNLLTIIDDLLDFSKIASGKLSLERVPFSLRAAVSDTLRTLVLRAQHKGLELRCEIRPEVPDALEGDAGRLRQVLTNLVGNAIKFTSRGEVAVIIEKGPDIEGGGGVTLVFTVRDTGIGIARDKQESIFRAFEQEDASTTRKYGGTGLGLTISAQLASLMDGQITVESEPGRGSTFRFTARFGHSAHPAAAAVAFECVEPASADESSPAPQLRVLVAEDNDLNVTLLQHLFAKRGHLAEFARDGAVALELALRGGFDVMLLDLHMPGLDGFDVVRGIRDHESGTGDHLPILALTARSSARDRERCLAAGMDEFLAKPIETAALWTLIARLTRGRYAAKASKARVHALLDPRAILRTCGGDADVLETLRSAFHHHLPALVSRARAALTTGHEGELRDAAHQLISTVGAFSTVAADVASTLEDAAIRGDRESSAVLVEQLESMCASLIAATRALSIEDVLAH